MAGLTLRLYASEHPSAVSGMVLVDATTEDVSTRIWPLIPEEHLAQFRENLKQSPEGLDMDTFRQGMDDVRRSSRTLGTMPLVVLTGAGKTPPQVSPEVDARMAETWLEIQALLPRLSSNHTHVVTENSGHFIHLDEPALVLAAIREVLRASRTRTPVQRERVLAGSVAKRR
jgi:pimeloyl-ACP methyl ester carboxylesterase